jgi:hypothetical protein
VTWPDRILFVFCCMLGGAVLGLIAMHVFGVAIGSNCSQPIGGSCPGGGASTFLLWVCGGGLVGLMAGSAISVFINRRSS